MKFMIADKHGFPVEKIKGRWFTNIIRLLIHGRRLSCRSCFDSRNKKIEIQTTTSNPWAESARITK